MKINIKVIQFDIIKSIGWFRVFGFGLRWKDLRNHDLVFSERNGYTKHFEVGNFSFSTLK